MNKLVPAVLLLLGVSAGGGLTACNDSDNIPTPADGTLAGRITPANGVVAVRVIGDNGDTMAATLDTTTGVYALAHLAAGAYRVAYTPNGGYRTPTTQTAAVADGATTTLLAVRAIANQDIIMAKSWRLTDFVVAGFSTYNQGLPDDCVKDNVYTFNPDQTLSIDEGALKCSATDPQTRTGQWGLGNRGADLQIQDDISGLQTGTITRLDTTTFVLHNPGYQFPGGNVEDVEWTFSAQ